MNIEQHLVDEFQRLSALINEKRKAVDHAIKELVEAERAAERAGCAIDAARNKGFP